MGKFLFVRVSVSTYDENEVKKNFPSLSNLAWSENDMYIPASQRFGILELIQSLSDSLEFAQWTNEKKEILENGIKTLFDLKQKLEKDVLEWKPQEANEITFLIEEELTELEKKAKQLKE